MDRIRYFAELSVLRALGFATLAVATLMLGLSFDLELCLKTGGVLSGIVGAVLFSKAWNAIHRDYRRTEVWMLLKGDPGVPEHRAQQAIGTVLRDTYRRYGEYAAFVGATLWLGGFLYGLAFPVG